jgi:hypothetical protein
MMTSPTVAVFERCGSTFKFDPSLESFVKKFQPSFKAEHVKLHPGCRCSAWVPAKWPFSRHCKYTSALTIFWTFFMSIFLLSSIPTLATYGAAGGTYLLFFTSAWKGQDLLQYVPLYNTKYAPKDSDM